MKVEILENREVEVTLFYANDIVENGKEAHPRYPYSLCIKPKSSGISEMKNR